MKQVFLMLVFTFIILCKTNAQYKIHTTPIGTVVRCSISIEPLFASVLTWTEDDMITWIFPDGQVVQEKIDLSGTTTPTNGTDQVDWVPSNYMSSNKIIVNVTKKGGTGNPSLTQVETTETTFTLPSSLPSTMPNIDFPAGLAWQVNHTWDFASGYYTYLMITYRNIASECPSSISVTLPPDVVYMDKHCFNKESVTGSTEIKIENLYKNNTTNKPYHHVLLKLFVNPQLSVGTPLVFNIKMEGNDIGLPTPCGPDSLTLSQTVKKDPHDPNHKTVNIKRICNSKTSTKLRYRVQFHNDGKAPVDSVMVWDPLADELIPGSFQMVSAAPQNGLEKLPTMLSIGTSKTIGFVNASLKAGLPGLGQTDVIHVYSQTIYAFEFEVLTRPNFNRDIHNYAVVTFYNSAGKPLAPITTTVETVYYGCPKTSFCKCLRSLFRPKKERPKP